MSLRFIYGRAGSGKSHFCLNDIKARVDEGANETLVLLVPEQYTLQAERNLIKTLGVGGIINTEVLSFRRLAYRVFNEIGGITYPHINAASKCMIIHKILEDMKDSFHAFLKASNQKGFVNTISDTLTEFKRYNVTPELLEHVQNSITDNDVLKEKLKELNIIYSEFEKVIRAKYRDSDDDLSLLAEKLESSNQFLGAEIWIDEFSGFTPQEYKVITKLFIRASRVNISLCTDCLIDEKGFDSSDIFSTVKAEVSKVMALARDNNIKIESPVMLKNDPLYRFKSSGEIAHMEKNIYFFPYSKYSSKTEDISIFSSANIFSEIENASREIVKLCRDKGLRYKDIAVVTGNLEAYEKQIGAIFNEYKIPYFIDKKTSISNHPLAKLITAIFEILSSNWSYEAVFRFLKTGLSGIETDEIDFIENYVLACGIKGNRWTQKEGWRYKTEISLVEGEKTDAEEDMYIKINNIRQRITKPLMAFREKTKGKNSAARICEALFELLCEIDVNNKIEELIKEFVNNGQLILANEYGQVWNIVMDIFDQITEVFGEEALDIERFSNILNIGFGEYKIGLIPPSLDQVLVGNIARSKTHEVKALFVLGVNDGIFPSTADHEGILSDKDRDDLKVLNLEISSGARIKAFEEQFQIYTTLTSSGKYLRLSYPIADHEGKSLRPSILISKLRKVFPEISEYSNIINYGTDAKELEAVSAAIPTFNEMVGNMRKSYEGLDIKPLWWDVYSWYLMQEDWLNKCETLKASLKFTNQVKQIHKDNIRKLYGSSVYSSISRFERYASCPFSFYVQYGLKAYERKVYKLNSPDVGTFMHAVIERFSRDVSSKSISWREFDFEWCTQRVSDIVDEMLDTMQGTIMNGSIRYKTLAKRLKRVLVRAIWLIAEHIKRSSFNPIGYEMGFGEGEEFPPITLELSSGEKISLVGRIDRIDAFKSDEGTYLRIIDYKTGNKAFKLSDIFYGMQIQLITYLDAIWENGGMNLEKPILPGGMFYFRVDDPIIKGNKNISEEEVEKAIIKQLKMKGLLLADVKLLKEMDSQIDGSSMIIPARINKDGVLGRSSAATIGQFEVLRKYVKRLLVSIGEEMFNGDIAIRPFKNKRIIPCQYCSYSSICQFDPLLKDNKYKIINDKSDEEVWALLEDTSKKNGNTLSIKKGGM